MATPTVIVLLTLVVELDALSIFFFTADLTRVGGWPALPSGRASSGPARW
jgi:hypothetical protein